MIEMDQAKHKLTCQSTEWMSILACTTWVKQFSFNLATAVWKENAKTRKRWIFRS